MKLVNTVIQNISDLLGRVKSHLRVAFWADHTGKEKKIREAYVQTKANNEGKTRAPTKVAQVTPECYGDEDVSVYWTRLKSHTDIKTQGYVGIASNAEKRFAEHLAASKRDPQTILHHALVEYGDEVFVEVVNASIPRWKARSIEKQLRPVEFIGWNHARGGGDIGSQVVNHYDKGRNGGRRAGQSNKGTVNYSPKGTIYQVMQCAKKIEGRWSRGQQDVLVASLKPSEVHEWAGLHGVNRGNLISTQYDTGRNHAGGHYIVVKGAI